MVVAIAVPSELNALTLRSAKTKQLKHWIQLANDAAPKRVMNKTGKQEVLREKLAAYYNIDLSAPDVVSLPVGPLTIDRDIQRRQWAHLRELAQEWRESARAGRPFLLCTPAPSRPVSDPFDATAAVDTEPGGAQSDAGHGLLQLSLLREIQQVLEGLKGLQAAMHTGGSSAPPPPPFAHVRTGSDGPLLNGAAAAATAATASHDAETVCAWMGAAARGDYAAVSHLQRLLMQSMVSLCPSITSGQRPPVPSPPHLAAPLNSNIHWPPAVPFGTSGLNVRATDSAGRVTALPSDRGRQHEHELTPCVSPRAPAAPSVTTPTPCRGPQTCRPECNTAAVPVPSASSPGASTIEDEELLDAELLDACAAEVRSLKRANGLRCVIEQVEQGAVRQMREQYGPEDGGRKATSVWDNIKGTITRRERLYKQFETEFGADKERFFAFFSVDTPPPRKRQKTGPNAVHEHLRPLRRVVEAIPKMRKDIKAEMRKSEYIDARTGTFSHALWMVKWGSANKWEIWRRMGKERYGTKS